MCLLSWGFLWSKGPLHFLLCLCGWSLCNVSIFKRHEILIGLNGISFFMIFNSFSEIVAQNQLVIFAQGEGKEICLGGDSGAACSARSSPATSPQNTSLERLYGEVRLKREVEVLKAVQANWKQHEAEMRAYHCEERATLPVTDEVNILLGKMKAAAPGIQPLIDELEAAITDQNIKLYQHFGSKEIVECTPSVNPFHTSNVAKVLETSASKERTANPAPSTTNIGLENVRRRVCTMTWSTMRMPVHCTFWLKVWQAACLRSPSTYFCVTLLEQLHTMQRRFRCSRGSLCRL